MSKIIKPFGHLSRLVDPTQKVFEGEFRVAFYHDRIVVNGYCFHCQSKAIFEIPLSRGEARQLEHDGQYRDNMADYAADQLQRHHQCGLIYDNRHNVEDLEKDLQARDRIHLA